MQITFHGAARTVTGSKHLVEADGGAVLLDCGLFQGPRDEMEARNRDFPFDPRGVDAVVLSHAHLDHCGNLPNLVRQGFSGPIYATPPTADLSRQIMFDSAKIQTQDARYRNRKARGRGEPLWEPIYDHSHATEAAKQLERRDPQVAFQPAPGIQATFAPAGHILGAAVTVLELEERGRTVRLAFSGDLGREDIPMLKDPVQPTDVDYLVLESTYGDREHEPASDAYRRLRDILADCCAAGSKLILPSFAMGRTQDLVYAFHRMMDAGEVPQVPIYVDSPLATRITRVYEKHIQAYDAETQSFMRRDRHENPLDFPNVRYVESVQESKSLNDQPGPMIIISSAGMMTAGRILHHLAHAIGDPDNVVVVVSWQAPGTLGRRMVEGADQVRIFGKPFERRARVEVINGLSAHADRSDLLDFAESLSPGLQQVFLVHGEEKQAFALADGLRERGIGQVAVPEMGETFRL